MRFLCLHGFGANSEIFEVQIYGQADILFKALIQEQLGRSCEFVFIDGEIECESATGVSGVFPGPYLCYHPKIPTVSELTAARDLVLSALEEEGRFDGLIGFSQGAALAASLILQHLTQTQPLVRCAIFFSGALPWMLRSEVIALHHHHPGFQPAKLAVSFPPEVRDRLMVYSDLQEQKGLVEEVLWIYLFLSPLRFPIPTTFIHGRKKDDLSFQAMAFIGLGNEKIGVKVMNHEAGHIFPRGESFTGDMTEAAMWTIERTCFQS